MITRCIETMITKEQDCSKGIGELITTLLQTV